MLLILLAFAIRTSWFQTYLGQEATTYLSKDLERVLKIEKIDIVFADRVVLEGVFSEDKFGDTLIYAQEIDVKIDSWSLDSLYLNVANISLINSTVNLKKAKGDSTFNFQHLVDYFKSENTDTTSTEFELDVQKVSLSNVNFTYNDNNHPAIAYGMDYSHIGIKNLRGEISDVNLNGDSISTEINHLSFSDQSGLKLDDFSAELLYSPTLISLNNLDIRLKNSTVKAEHLKLITENGADDFQDFLNQVRFDANLSETSIALTDLALFVPQINGMTDDVQIRNAEIRGPVNGMRINNTDIRLLESTILKGNFQIPDLTDINQAFINENITLFRTSVRDIERLNLSPFLEREQSIQLPDNLLALNVIELRNGHFTGLIENFVVDGDITTGIGNLYSENGLKFKKENGIYTYQGQLDNPEAKDVIVEDLNLGLLANNTNLGMVNGYLHLLEGSQGFSTDDMNLLFTGEFNSIELNDYNYKHVVIKEGKYYQERFEGVIDVKDDNLALNYDGYVDFKDELLFDFDLKIDSSYLAKMNLVEGDLSTKLNTKVNVNLTGNSLDNIKGNIDISKLSYYDGVNQLDVSDLQLKVERGDSIDKVLVSSEYIDCELIGQFDFSYLYPVLKNQLAILIPNLLDQEEVPEDIVQNYILRLNLNDVNPISKLL